MPGAKAPAAVSFMAAYGFSGPRCHWKRIRSSGFWLSAVAFPRSCKASSLALNEPRASTTAVPSRGDKTSSGALTAVSVVSRELAVSGRSVPRLPMLLDGRVSHVGRIGWRAVSMVLHRSSCTHLS